MHSDKPSGLVYQYLTLTKKVMHAVLKTPSDQHEWLNVAQLMLCLRQALACLNCGALVGSCKHSKTDEDTKTGQREHRNAAENTKYIVEGFVNLCKLLVAKDMAHRWYNIQMKPICSADPISFGDLIFEVYNSKEGTNGEGLGDRFKKKLKEKVHHCRCGGKASGNLTCLGQRCACYREGKGCVNCKCSGCKNPNGTPNRLRNPLPT